MTEIANREIVKCEYCGKTLTYSKPGLRIIYKNKELRFCRRGRYKKFLEQEVRNV